MNTNPILIIDDDDDDLELIKQVFKELKVESEIIVFNDGYKFLDFIKEADTKAFFILCDISMAKISGIELKKRAFEDEELRIKCVPFIFLSTSEGSRAVMEAYSYGVQGYFIKPNRYEEWKDMLCAIVNYWGHSEHPNR